MYDAIVVGARCAGATTALLLARKGHRVLLVDRATFPSDIPHGHFIHRDGPRRLHEWGLLPRLTCPAITKMTLDLEDFPLVGTDLVWDGVALGYGPRRHLLDQALITAALEAGVEFRPGFSVEEYLSDGDAITGIRSRQVSEHARITIGADGRNSRLAQAVTAPTYEEAPSATCWYFSYWSDCPLDGIEVRLRGRNVLFAFPTDDGLTAIFIAWPASEFSRVKQRIEESFLDTVDKVPELAEKVRAGRREERFYGTGDVPNFFRRPFGDGWALVGDAGHHKDPYLALGVADAFRDADLLSSAVHEGLSGQRPMAEALAGYEEGRNRAAMKDYRENLYLAQFQPLPKDLLAMRAAIRERPEAIRQFFKGLLQ